MKIIELTDKQQKQLLEMCKHFYKEYKNIDLGFDEESNTFNIFLYELYDFIKGYYSYSKIHWFEFCLTSLSYKLHKLRIADKLGLNYEYDDENHMQEAILISYRLYNEHPVDFLYKYFKSIKNEK